MLSPPSWSCKQGSDFGLVTLTPHSLGSRCLSKMRVTSLPAALHPAFAATQSGFSDTVLCLHRLRSFTGLSFQFHVRCVGGLLRMHQGLRGWTSRRSVPIMVEFWGRQRFLTKTGELRQTQLNRSFHSMLWPVGQHGMRIWFMPLALLLSRIFQRRGAGPILKKRGRAFARPPCHSRVIESTVLALGADEQSCTVHRDLISALNRGVGKGAIEGGRGLKRSSAIEGDLHLTVSTQSCL